MKFQQKKKMIVGIDTSCYTSSLSVIDPSGKIFLDKRLLLQVKSGEKGLRQSEAVFQHLQNLPQLLDVFINSPITGITASVIPRPVTDSYLPVFKVGASFGETAAKLIGVPFIETSHQEGHIRAGLYQQTISDRAFLAWHISGGTTELLFIETTPKGYVIRKIGGTSDLQAGQFVDRIGVGLGLSFPAGQALEALALHSDTAKSLPVVTKELTLSFSGPASAAERLITQMGAGSGIAGAELARQVINCIGLSILKVTLQAVRECKVNQVLLVGGVASNQIIRDFLISAGIKNGIDFHFGLKELSSDNAVGVGLLGYDYLNGVNK